MMKKAGFLKDVSDKSQAFLLLSENLSHLMMANKVSLTELSRSTQVAMPTLKRLQTDPTANPTISTVLPVARYFGLSVEQLVSERVRDLPGSSSLKLRKIPLIAWSDAVHFPDVQVRSSREWISINRNVSQSAFALTVEADDWLGMSKGSQLIVDPDIRPLNRHYVLLYREGMQVPGIKQRMEDENRVYYRSLNPLLPLIPGDDQHRVLGVVVQTTYL